MSSQGFINVQNIVLDSLDQFWVVDSGISFNATQAGANAVYGGAKIMSFNQNGTHLVSIELRSCWQRPDGIFELTLPFDSVQRTYKVPKELLTYEVTML